MPSRAPILITGGAGYIGSHTYVALLEAGFLPVILDNFSRSKPGVLIRLQAITGQPVLCYGGNVSDVVLVQELLRRHKFGAVIHMAGFKSVGESVAHPLSYVENNIGGMTALLRAMETSSCRTLVFSSSATVYGDPPAAPITEDFPRSHTNPYGMTKLACEDLLSAMRAADPAWRIGVLRYFNPVGAHASGLIGEDPRGMPDNLMPFVAQVAAGKRTHLTIYGDDYDTPDGTGVRDYLHVQDLALAHVAAVTSLLEGDKSFTVNVGTGQGHSVLEVTKAFERSSGQAVPYRLAPRRPGDVAQYCADCGLAQKLLGWRAKHSLADMCADTWRWQRDNPNGYDA